ncbi:MAG: GNAT family N-acetyltransferase [Coriobacteriia bacterium]|nr:GNAT family N-acetyltransferase [Coriobacteriia bacterium]
MARRFSPLTPERVGELPSNCPGCVFWESPERLEPRCGVRCDAELLSGWMDYVGAQWGECGRIATEDGHVLGFVKYAPAVFFPQARNFAVGPPSEGAILIACLHISREARQRGLGKVLLQAALRDLVSRNERTVEAYAAAARPEDFAASPVVGQEFLERQGFSVLRPHPVNPLMRLDLRSLAAWTENLEAVLESLRIPVRPARRVPTPYIEGRR